ncbi:MAG: MFS transporter [archaeon]
MVFKENAALISTYCVAHAFVDAICALVALYFVKAGVIDLATGALLILTYNILAFALQAPIGFVCDRIGNAKLFAVGGVALVLLGMGSYQIPILAILLIGAGNAIFHVGLGVVSLSVDPKKAAVPGIMVSTGALGLLVGGLIAATKQVPLIEAFLIGIIICVALFYVKAPQLDLKKEKAERKIGVKEIAIVGALLLLISICVRGLVGMALAFPWKADMTLLITLTIGVVLGKALGGIIGDKFGWLKVAVIALVLSIPLIYLGWANSALGIIGVFLFNMTMPITLVAISNLLPGRKGFAFGLTTLALVIGALPVFLGAKGIVSTADFVLMVSIVSATALAIGLILHNNVFAKVKSTKNNKSKRK